MIYIVSILCLIAVVIFQYFWHISHPKTRECLVFKAPSDADWGIERGVIAHFFCGAVVRQIVNSDLRHPAIARHENELERFGILECLENCPAVNQCPWVKRLMTEGSCDVQLVGRINRKPFDHVDWDVAGVSDKEAKLNGGLSRTVTLLGREPNECHQIGPLVPQPFSPVEKSEPTKIFNNRHYSISQHEADLILTELRRSKNSEPFKYIVTRLVKVARG